MLIPAPDTAVRFAHESERRLAEMLDFYRITWEYEPVEFALSWGSDGQVNMAFRPDFYLPDLDLFIELTTLRQELVTRKNRKVRRLRELHPGINLKVLYRRDYNNLLFKADPLAAVLSMQEVHPFGAARGA